MHFADHLNSRSLLQAHQTTVLSQTAPGARELFHTKAANVTPMEKAGIGLSPRTTQFFRHDGEDRGKACRQARPSGTPLVAHRTASAASSARAYFPLVGNSPREVFEHRNEDCSSVYEGTGGDRPGWDLSDVVQTAPEGCGFRPGDRMVAWYGWWLAERVAVPASRLARIPTT